jgi:hypothetical protein
MNTECSQKEFNFQGLKRRRFEAAFNGWGITADTGGLLLREVKIKCWIILNFAECFKDYRDKNTIEYTV